MAELAAVPETEEAAGDDVVGTGEEEFDVGMKQNLMERDAADADRTRDRTESVACFSIITNKKHPLALTAPLLLCAPPDGSDSRRFRSAAAQRTASSTLRNSASSCVIARDRRQASNARHAHSPSREYGGLRLDSPSAGR